MSPDLWIEVSESALRNNFRALRSSLQNHPIIAVVKANGYGHGIANAGRIFAEEGAMMLAVTRLEEGIELREAGIDAPVLLLTPPSPENRAEAAARGFTQPLDSLDGLDQLPAGDYHLKVDTGMGRLGILPSEVASLKIPPAVRLTGTFTHFAKATDPELGSTISQLKVFERILEEMKAAGIDSGLRHAANSAAAFRLPASRLDAVRLGTILYGQSPVRLPDAPTLEPTWRARARVIAIRNLPKGGKVGYGGEVTLCRPTRVAVLPVGFADGFTMGADGPRRRMPWIKVAMDRKRVPTVKFGDKSALTLGRVSMQMISVDVTDLPEVQVGSVAEIPMLRLAANAQIPRLLV